jgi:hypothetical protein
LWALLVDDVEHTIVDSEEPFQVLRLEDLELETLEVHRMAMLFGDKLIAVIKPWVFRHFLSRGADAVVYLDGDIMVFDSLAGLFRDTDEGVVLIPHVLTPLPRDGLDPDETTLLGSGMFNAGMLGVGPRGGGFLDFLMERLERECVFDPGKMRFNEQRWLDFVPALFPHRVVRDLGYDVAYWNLHERPLEINDGRWLVGGEPLRGFHFSSFEPRARSAAGRFELATSAPRVRVSSDPLLKQLCDEYRAMLYAEGYSNEQDPPFAFDTLPDGVPVYGLLRELFRSAVLAADDGLGSYPPDPYDPSARDAFRTWASSSYTSVGLPLPLRMREKPVAASPKRSRAMNRWFPIGRPRLDASRATSHVELSAASSWGMDLLNRMMVDDAGERSLAGIGIRSGRAGFVCHGPRQQLVPGRYRLTFEFDADVRDDVVSGSDQALVIEAFVQGYVVGSRTVNYIDVGSGAVDLDIEIPEHLSELAVLLGVELRVLTRGQLSARLTAVLLEPGNRAGVAKGSWSSHNDWLPVMAGGDAGIRIGDEVRTMSGRAGVLVAGPNWRLPPGRYRVTVQTRGSGGGLGTEERRTDEPVVVIAVVIGEKVLSESARTDGEIAHSETSLEFVISDADAGPEAEVGVRVRTVAPIDAAVTGVVVDRIDELSRTSESVA